ncbi:hypothetical protein [Oerskovia paurometabola]|uniref:Efflux transporter, RND family, MFP subunit n=1 Tax=Oerskovia paurometabola TaxID=162170 RepID=A0ABW1X582_9CELL|nr:hypothetical protein [Oerskovia paurometabola]MBM7496055.1 hypothetical protein [Oerskovia paurometabola]
MKRIAKLVIAFSTLGVIGAATLGGTWLAGADEDEKKASTEVRTAVVERGALSAGMRLTGNLTRGAVTQLSGSGEGVLTALPAAGAEIAAGQVLYEVDGRPVFLLTGTTPLWRALKLGDAGPDVLILKSSLAALGHDVGDASSDVYDTKTSDAVAALYRAAGKTPPSETSEGKKSVDDAQAGLVAANQGVVTAKKALFAGDVRPDALTIAQADAAVADAATALDEAAASGASTTLPQAQLDAAKKARKALDAPPDLTGQKQAVKDAEQQVVAAKNTLAVARAQSVGPGQVTVLSSPSIRVEKVAGRLGGAANAEIAQWTGMTTFVEAPVTASQQAALSIGGVVQVRVPSGDVLEGTIAAVGSAPGASADADAGDGEEGDGGGGAAGTGGDGAGGKTVLRVDIADQAAAAPLAGSAVTIEVSTDVAEDALIVPVTALLALAEGGYAVERVTKGDRVELVAVELGLIAEARVQVSSDALEAGDRVQIP